MEMIGVRIEAMAVSDGQSVTQANLEALEPYLDHIKESDAAHLAAWCTRNGYTVWATSHLQQLLTDASRRRTLPTDDDLLDELREDVVTTRHPEWMVAHWVERESEDPSMRQRLLNTAKRCVETNVAGQGFEIACWIVGAIGTRTDLIWLSEGEQGREDPRALEDARYRVESRTGEGYTSTRQ
jgi:hypothetical protein